MVTWFMDPMPSVADITSEIDLDVFKGIFGQMEIAPDTKRPHYQLYVVTHGPVRYSAIKKQFVGAHVEAAKSLQGVCVKYCSKEESRAPDVEPFEYPEGWLVSKQGARSDLAVAASVAREEGLRAVARAHPVQFIKFSQGLERYVDAMAEPPRMQGFQPVGWQAGLLEDLSKPPGKREVIWVYDYEGCKGKSELASYLICEKEAVELSGKIVDMAYVYAKQPIVVFDLCRTQADCVKHLYQFAEQLKNGRVLSTKYVCKHKYFPSPHVVFFANFRPDMTDLPWSKDRLRLLDLSNEPQLPIKGKT